MPGRTGGERAARPRTGGERASRRRTAAYTLVELVFALAIAAVALAALLATRFEPLIASRFGNTQNLRESRALEQSVRSLVMELQEATRIFHPVAGAAAPNGKGFDGLGFVDARGEVILYYVDATVASSSTVAPGARAKVAPRVMRLNLNAQRRGEATASSILLENVDHFYVNVAPAAPGLMASLVTCDVGVAFPAKPTPHLVSQLISVFPRSLETVNPDDMFPAGTPLR